MTPNPPSHGEFELRMPLGATPFGMAYRASIRATGQPVRLLSLAAVGEDPASQSRLLRRTRLTRLLDGPLALRILRLDESASSPLVVFEGLELEPLELVAQQGRPFDLDQAASLLQPLARGLAEAHRMGLFHGRLDPRSVLVAADGRIVVDFTRLVPFSGQETAFTSAALEPDDPWTGQADDLLALGRLLVWLTLPNGDESWRTATSLTDPTGEPDADALTLVDQKCGRAAALADLIDRLLAPDPGRRPSMADVVRCLDVQSAPVDPALPMTIEATRGGGPLVQPTRGQLDLTMDGRPELSGLNRTQLGRYKILEKLGQGGMGAVYRGVDTLDGSVVAVKVLSPKWAETPQAVRRFKKEARLLAEVNNPFVANLLCADEDDGIPYLVMEFVAGESLGRRLDRGPLAEREAAQVASDVCRALADAHRRGIIHRDVKPDNILLLHRDESKPLEGEASNGRPPAVKLLDFGLARHVEQDDSMSVTQAGTVVGTPHYMAPEQFTAAETLDARADVYSLGATLYCALAGRPPFQGNSPLAIIHQHASEPPPPLRHLAPSVTPAMENLVARALAKRPIDRFADASELLCDLDRILRGVPTAAAVHPLTPECDPARVIENVFTWDLRSPPHVLWPHVSNTERLNRAIGLPAVRFTTRRDEKGQVRRFAEARKAGFAFIWEEHPFEWVEGRRMGVLREFQRGPFRWLTSVVELEPRAGGTRLTHRIKVDPRGLAGRIMAALEIGIRTKTALERVYRRIDEQTGAPSRLPAADPFEPPHALNPPVRSRLEGLVREIIDMGVDPSTADRLGEYLASASDQEVARIRPLELARRWSLEPDLAIAACLHGVSAGLLVLLWDVICPACRVPARVENSLRAIRDHANCEACSRDFNVDFASRVEMIFRAHPQIRDAATETWCIGGPAHTPHVVAQARLAPGERIELDLALSAGPYQLGGPQLPFQVDLCIEERAIAARFDLTVGQPPPTGRAIVLRVASQALGLFNDTPLEIVLRVERLAPRPDALTASRAASMALFRKLFPGEVLSQGQLASVSVQTFLATRIDDGSPPLAPDPEEAWFAAFQAHLARADEAARRHGGAMVKSVEAGALAVFPSPDLALRAALDLLHVRGETAPVHHLIRCGIHSGPARIATLNDRLEYLGASVRIVQALAAAGEPGEIALSERAAIDPQVADRIGEAGWSIAVGSGGTENARLPPFIRVLPS